MSLHPPLCICTKCSSIKPSPTHQGSSYLLHKYCQIPTHAGSSHTLICPLIPKSAPPCRGPVAVYAPMDMPTSWPFVALGSDPTMNTAEAWGLKITTNAQALQLVTLMTQQSVLVSSILGKPSGWRQQRPGFPCYKNKFCYGFSVLSKPSGWQLFPPVFPPAWGMSLCHLSLCPSFEVLASVAKHGMCMAGVRPAHP